MSDKLTAIEQAIKLLEKVQALCAIADNISDIVEKSPADLQAQIALQLHAAKILTSDGEAEVLAERCAMLTDALVRIHGIAKPAMGAAGVVGKVVTKYDYQWIAGDALERAKPPVSFENEPAVGVRYGVQMVPRIRPEDYTC